MFYVSIIFYKFMLLKGKWKAVDLSFHEYEDKILPFIKAIAELKRSLSRSRSFCIIIIAHKIFQPGSQRTKKAI